MAKLIDLTGQRFGRLVVKSRAENRNASACWLCTCDCGGEKVVRSHLLLKGITKSCRCLAKETTSRIRKAEGDLKTPFRNIIYTYKKNARVDGRRWALTDEEAEALLFSPCEYCGVEPDPLPTENTGWKSVRTNGIDRVDNDHGYETWNSVPCCAICNKAKAMMAADEFISWACSVADHSRKKRGLRLVK